MTIKVSVPYLGTKALRHSGIILLFVPCDAVLVEQVDELLLLIWVKAFEVQVLTETATLLQ